MWGAEMIDDIRASLSRFGLAESINPFSATVGATIILAAFLRLYRLGHESLWLDETLSIAFVTRRYTTLELLIELPITDPHPPLYYLLLDGWVGIFGTSEAAVRLLSALFGIAAVILIYTLGAKMSGREAGIVAAMLLGFSPFHIYYSQEARMYTLLAVLTLASYYLFVDLLDTDGNPNRRTIAVYVAVTVLMGYTHVYGFLIILAQNIYALPRILLGEDQWPHFDVSSGAPISLFRWFSIQTAVGLLLGPWIFVLVQRVVAASGGNDTPISWILTPEPIDLLHAVSSFFFHYGADAYDGVVIQIGVLAIVAALTAVAVVVRPNSDALQLGPAPGVSMLVVLFLTPILGAYLLSITVTPIFVSRYMISASLGLFLLVGIGAATLREIGSQEVLQGGANRLISTSRYVFIGLVIAALIIPLPTYYNTDQKEQWREAVAEVESSVTDSAVVITDDYMIVSYRYYAERDGLAIVPIDDSATGDQIRTRLEGHNEVWVLESHAEHGSVVSYLQRPDTEFRLVDGSKRQYNGIQMYNFVRK